MLRVYNKYIKSKEETTMFYGVVFGNWHGIGLEDLVDVFYNEEDAERECDRLNGDCDPDEYYEVWELNEEQVKKYWGDLEIS